MSTVTDVLNNLLNPVIHQVIGSTPESMVKYLKDGGLKNNKESALRLAAIAIFASAVNKTTLESFLIIPEVAPVRAVIMNSFSISGRTNMTALTLLGHCILTTDKVDDVAFAREFRAKMGQAHLWAGDLGSGSLSEKQKGIMKEKKRNVNENSAKLFGSGYWKFTGVDPAPMSYNEAVFWGENYMQREPATVQHSYQNPVSFHRASPSTGSNTGFGGPPTFRSTPKASAATVVGSNLEASPPSVHATISEAGPATVTLTMSDGKTATLPKDIVTYYLTVTQNDVPALERSVRKNGVDAWVKKYGPIMRADPEMKGISGSSIVG